MAEMGSWNPVPLTDDEGQVNASSLLKLLTVSGILAGAAGMAWALIIGSPFQFFAIVFGLLLIGSILSIGFIQTKRFRAASLFFIISTWLAITIAVAYTGGINSALLPLYLFIICLAGLFLGVEGGLIFLLISIAAGVAVVWLESSGMLPKPLIHYTDRTRHVLRMASALMTLFVFFLSLWNTRTVLKRTRSKMENISQSEEARRKAETRYRTLIEQVPAIVYTAEFGDKGHWRYVSPQIENLLGYTTEEWEKRPELWYDQLHPDDRQKAIDEEIYSRQTGKPLRSEYRLLSKNRENEIWFLDEATVIADSSGMPLLLQGVMHDITVRKNVEERLSQSENKYRQLTELLPQMVIETDVSGKITFANQKTFNTFGFGMEDFEGTLDIFQMISPQHRELIHTTLQRHSKSMTGFNTEYIATTRDGHNFPILFFAAPILNVQKLLGFRCVIIDITDRKNAEEELKQSEERFRSTFHSAPIGMAIVDFNDRFLQVNQAFCNLLGYTREQLLSKTVAEIKYHDGNRTTDPKTIPIEKQDKSFTFEQRYIHADGRIVWGLLHVTLVTDKNKKPLYFLQQVQDITGRKRTENLLRISGNRFRALIENATDVITVLDADGTISYSSPSTQRVLGYSSAEYLETNFIDKVHADDQIWVKALFTELVNSGGVNFVAEFRYKHRDESWRWIELKATNAMTDPSVGGVIANYRDITDNRNAKESIQTRAAQQSVLAQISQRALIERNLSILMTDMVESIVETLGVEYCMILELMPEGDMFLFKAGIGWEDGLVGKLVRDNNGSSYPGYTLSNRAPVIVEDWNLEKRFSDQELLCQHGIVSGMSVPIEGRDVPYGVLEIHSTRYRSFTHNDIHFLQAIANVLGAAIGRIKADEALRNSEERYMLVATGANDGLWDWNLRTNDIYYSPRWKEMLGYADDEINNDIDEWLGRVHPVDLERVKSALSPNLNVGELRFETEFRIRHKDNSYRWALNRGVVIRDPEGVAYRMAGSLTDITERKSAEQQLQFDAFHDVLTGLANRAYLTDRLAHVINIGKRKSSYRFAVLFLDLDEFKVVNDRFGHGVGDKFLIEVSRRLASTMRSMDTLARLGGDEFVILLEDISDVNEATLVAERVQLQLSEVFDLADVKITASASIGIVCNDFPYESSEEILRDADIAMYSAKASGKAHYQVFSLSLREQTIIRLEREVDLRHALERNQFRIYYQPIYDFASRLPIGVEALLRWKHPTQGLIMPSEFIKIAEDSNLIIPIDCFVLREACLQIRRWENSYPAVREWMIHVNLSSKHFIQPNLIETIEGIIRETGFESTRVNLEITESAIMDNLELATMTTRHLRDFGIHIGIDDFGTGYASLNYLTRFPVDVLKLDQSFVPRIMTDTNTREIIDTVVKLANKLGIRVIAEGVETAEQVSELQNLGCEFGQGYLFSRPVDKDAIANMVSRIDFDPNGKPSQK